MTGEFSSSAPKRRRSMERDGKGRKLNEMIVPPVLQEDKFMKLEESLFPGISNDVALAQISTLLPWTTFRNLASSESPVGPAWRQAIQDRLVYDARVGADSGDRVLVISDTKSTNDISKPTAILLHSLRNKAGYRLPSIPQVEGGFPYDCECIALDGNVYILGGSKECSGDFQQPSSKDVYVLDVAGKDGQWKQCASMQKARANFKCGAKDGKIYVFGGTCGNNWVLESEVYDPSEDAWSAIAPMGTWPREPIVSRGSVIDFRDFSFDNVVATGGLELVVLGGDFHLRGYHPVTDTWLTLSENFELGPLITEFVAQGKLHQMSRENICVYDIERNEWIERHTFSLSSVSRQRILWPVSVLAVDNEILAIMERRRRIPGKGSNTCLLRSKGFGSGDRNIEWEKLPFSGLSIEEEYPSMCLLKL